MRLPTHTTAYRGPNGKIFVYTMRTPSRIGDVLFSPDGETYYTLIPIELTGDHTNHTLKFKGLPNEGISQLQLGMNGITFAGELYREGSPPASEITIITPSSF